MAAPNRVARKPFAGRRVLLGVTGGIAAVKSVTLARELALAGAQVDTVLTAGALDFVKPLVFEALTGSPTHIEASAPGDALRHIRLARSADLVVVAPATADFLARSAAGMADDLLTAVLLATSAPVLLCPAMNDRMFAHPVTQANLRKLEEAGYKMLGPADGLLAWGEGSGPGRMLEPETILDHIGRHLTGDTSLAGRRVIVTAGPTREPIDPVRFIGNRSSGRMGYSIAEGAWRMGADVVLISGPSALTTPTGVRFRPVETAEQMLEAVNAELPDAAVLVMAAAVADFKPANVAAEKIKKEAGPIESVELHATADILRATAPSRPRDLVVVGFALETESPLENGRRKLEQKDLDLIVVNDAREPGAGFEVETNRVTILDRDGQVEELPLLSKSEVAIHILERVAARFRPAP